MSYFKDLPRRKKFAWIYLGGISVLGAAGFFYWLIVWKYKAFTTDAYVIGNQVMLTPLQSGFVKSIYTDNTFLVEEGQLLVALDETNAKIALQNAEENLANTVRQVCQNFHDVFALRADIEAKKAEYIKAAQDYEHRSYVLKAGGVSLEDFEHAEAALRSSFFLLQMSEVLFDKALSLVQDTTLLTHPLVLVAASQARQAWVNLYRCNIYSPVRGVVAQRSIQVGMWIPAGHPMMAVIPLDQIWANANFKETQMKHMRIGQPVKITADMYGDDVIFHGKIVGLPGGAGNAFSILPPQNLSGNWIKIVQRLPVRVALEESELKKHPLRIGMTLKATVDLRPKGEYVQDSPIGSPSYKTDIFQYEETGDQSWINEVIRSNIDPSLNEFKDFPLHLDMFND